MKKKANRLDAIKMIISSKEVGSQEELLQELNREGFELTQATLSRDLKQLKELHHLRPGRRDTGHPGRRDHLADGVQAPPPF